MGIASGDEDRTWTVARARVLRHDQTEAERRLWGIVRNRRLGGLKFRRQVPINGFIADFLCAEHRLIVELDGGQHAGAGLLKDARRTAALERQGYRVIRFWNADVFINLSGVCDAILAAAAPSPQPSPPVGERAHKKPTASSPLPQGGEGQGEGEGL